MKTSGELSNMRCDKAKPREAPYRLADGGGLCLLISPAGGKLWQYRYRFEGKGKLMALGKYPDVPLARARALHAEARALLAAGTDPMALRKEAKEEKKAALAEEEKTAEFTFEKLARLWLAWWKTDKKPRYAGQVESRLEKDLIAHIGRRPAASVTPQELVELTKATDERGARDIAKRNLQFIRQIYRWGKSHGYLSQNLTNPAGDIDAGMVLSKAQTAKFAHVKIEEVPELLRAMRDYSGTALTRIALELIALTFVRPGSLRKALWTEIHWEDRQWRIPPENMKIPFPHIVPLSKQAMLLLERLQRISGATGKLFPEYNNDAGFMSEGTLENALHRIGYKGRMTPHGWRHVASTYLRNKGKDKWWVEAQLSHQEGGVAGIYNEAEYLKDRTEMMQFWADSLDELRERAAGKLHRIA